ncbi:MAG: Trk system potassium transporter TrkA [Haloarculaceae archaeon]
MYVIVVGAGEVGSTIAANLAGEHEVAVVDLDPDLVESLTYDLDVLPVEGDGTRLDTLREAGIEKADMLIASTDDDETNVVTCGTAVTAGDPFTIARVKNVRFLETWQHSEGAFGVDFMVCTDLETAEAIVRVVGLPAASDVDTFADGAVRMAQFEVPEGSPVANTTVAEADRFEQLTFAAILREEEFVIPRGDTEIQEGDDLVVIGAPESVRAFGGDLAPREGGPRDVVILGGSDAAYETARLLEERGFSPRLVERDPERARDLAEALPDTTVFEQDATDREFLESEHVGEADVAVAALDSEQRNLLASLLAKQLGVDRAIAVVDTAEYVEVFEAVGVDVAVNPRTITAEEITRFTRERHTENVAIIEGDRAEVIEVEVDETSVLAGRTIRDAVADLPEGIVIGAITRGGEFVTPRGDTRVEVGDHVVLLAERDAIEAAMSAL